jgi:hypothetical protein
MPGMGDLGVGADDVERYLTQVRAICLALPRTAERPSHGRPAFFAGPRCFGMFMADHHGDGRLALWCAAPEGAQAELVQLEPDRFFRPPYVGHRGWLGVLLLGIEVPELRAICREAYTCTAPATALRQLAVQDEVLGIEDGQPRSAG